VTINLVQEKISAIDLPHNLHFFNIMIHFNLSQTLNAVILLTKKERTMWKNDPERAEKLMLLDALIKYANEFRDVEPSEISVTVLARFIDKFHEEYWDYTGE
jgi:vesicle coat complex subunit